MSAPDSPPLVAGIGSPYGADRLGWAVIEALQTNRRAVSARLLCCALPTELTSLLLNHPRAIVVDAMLGDGPPGRIHRLRASDLARPTLHLSSHGHGLAEAVQLAEALGYLSPQLSILALDVVSPQAPLRAEWIVALTDAVCAELAALR